MSIAKKAGELMSACAEITLASVSQNGYPRICVLSRTKSEGVRKVYVSTGMSSVKTAHFQENPKASVCVWKDGNSITLTGKVTVMQDREIREEMWMDWFIEHFPGGIDDPNYCILAFETEEATLWIDGEFVTLSVGEL